jgi:two-component system response regulator
MRLDSKTILLVEDNPSDVGLTLRPLEQFRIGNKMVVAEDRQEALDYKLPVVILTTSKQEEDIAAGYEFGANSYVRKPVDFRELAAAVAHLGLYWLVLNQARPNIELSR